MGINGTVLSFASFALRIITRRDEKGEPRFPLLLNYLLVVAEPAAWIVTIEWSVTGCVTRGHGTRWSATIITRVFTTDKARIYRASQRANAGFVCTRPPAHSITYVMYVLLCVHYLRVQSVTSTAPPIKRSAEGYPA